MILRDRRRLPKFRKRADTAGTVDHTVDSDLAWIDERGSTHYVRGADATGDDGSLGKGVTRDPPSAGNGCY